MWKLVNMQKNITRKPTPTPPASAKVAFQIEALEESGPGCR
jgi:hypothetical protein